MFLVVYVMLCQDAVWSCLFTLKKVHFAPLTDTNNNKYIDIINLKRYPVEFSSFMPFLVCNLNQQSVRGIVWTGDFSTLEPGERAT